jgi:uncharacterized protein YjcR
MNKFINQLKQQQKLFEQRIEQEVGKYEHFQEKIFNQVNVKNEETND